MVEAGVASAAPILLLTPAGDSDEDDAATPGRRPELPGQLVSIEIRETDIESSGTLIFVSYAWV
jgi:hypothetical protein